jgi:hypothetical protein
VDEFIAKHSSFVDEDGKRIISMNGYMTEREVLTGIAPLTIEQPRVDGRDLSNHSQNERFTNNILPRYLRRILHIDNLIPVLCLK